MPARGRTALRADLENPASALDGVMDPKSFLEIASQGFLAIYMFACLHRVNCDLGVPRIMRGNNDSVDVLALEQLSVIDAEVGILELRRCLGPVTALVEKVAGCADYDIVLAGLFVDALQMVLADAEADTDDAHRNAIVGANDTPGRWGLVLPVNRSFEQRGGSDGSSGRSRFLDEFPPRKTGR